MTPEEKKKSMLYYFVIGCILGFFLALVFWSLSKNPAVFILSPVAGVIGAAQAYLMPERDEKK